MVGLGGRRLAVFESSSASFSVCSADSFVHVFSIHAEVERPQRVSSPCYERVVCEPRTSILFVTAKAGQYKGVVIWVYRFSRFSRLSDWPEEIEIQAEVPSSISRVLIRRWYSGDFSHEHESAEFLALDCFWFRYW
nr:MAG TPA: hypothetical protein [Caudoviricetes sp.]